MIQVLAATLLAITSVSTTSPMANWQSDYGKALEATRSDERPLLIVLDVPSDPTAAVDGKKLQSTDSSDNVLDAYQCCHVDVSTTYGKEVAKAFGAKEFPFAAIIDKTGSVVLCKKSGKLSTSEWQKTLATYKKGEQQAQVIQNTFFRGGVDTSVLTPSNCPSCQLRAQQGF